MESFVLEVNLKSGTNILYWRTGGVLMGSKVVKPVLLKNIQIEGSEQLFLFFLLLDVIFDKAFIWVFPHAFFVIVHQEWLTHLSVFRVSQEHSAKSQAPPRVISALVTLILAMVPAPAPPATPQLSTQVGIRFQQKISSPQCNTLISQVVIP